MSGKDAMSPRGFTWDEAVLVLLAWIRYWPAYRSARLLSDCSADRRWARSSTPRTLNLMTAWGRIVRVAGDGWQSKVPMRSGIELARRSFRRHGRHARTCLLRGSVPGRSFRRGQPVGRRPSYRALRRMMTALQVLRRWSPRSLMVKAGHMTGCRKGLPAARGSWSLQFVRPESVGVAVADISIGALAPEFQCPARLSTHMQEARP